MKRNWIAALVIAGGLEAVAFGQQYPPSQGDPNYNGQYGGQYSGDQGYDDSQYDDNYQGEYAPPPPPMRSYAYRPSMPGHGYVWVDGYWNFFGGRYSWVSGYWMRPPFSGGFWVAPRYTSGHFYRGFWGGGRVVNRGFVVRNDYRYRGYVQPSRPVYRAPERNGYRSNDNRGGRVENHGQHGGRR